MAHFDETDMWGAPPSEPNPENKDNASVRFDFANGRIYYEAMGSSIISATNYANFGINANNPDSFEDDFWGITQSLSGSSGDEIEEPKIITRYLHRFGIDRIILQCKARYNLDVSGGAWNDTSVIEMYIRSSEGGSDIMNELEVISSSGSYSDETLTLSGLNDTLSEGNYYIIEISLRSNLDGDVGNSGSDSATLETFLREDIYLTTGT